MEGCEDAVIQWLCVSQELSNPGTWVDLGITAGTNMALNQVAGAIQAAAAESMIWMTTAWVSIPTPSVAPVGAETVGFMQESVWWYTLGLVVMSLIIGGIRMMMQLRIAPLLEVLRSLVTFILAAVAGVTAITLLITAADEFSAWVIERSTDGASLAENMFGTFQPLLEADPTGATEVSGAITSAATIVAMGIIAFFLNVGQILMLLIRGAMLVLLTGLLPTAAAFTNTESGQQWFKRFIAWTLAFILYKPIAALIYATAFYMLSNDSTGEGAMRVITGFTILFLALLSLPALLRFIAPATSAVSSAVGGGALLAGGAALASALPTGARLATAGATGSAAAAAPATPAASPSVAGGSTSGGGGPSGGGGDNGAPSGGNGSGGATGASGSRSAGPQEAGTSTGTGQRGPDSASGTHATGSQPSVGDGGQSPPASAGGPSGGVATGAVAAGARAAREVRSASDSAIEGSDPDGSK